MAASRAVGAKALRKVSRTTSPSSWLSHPLSQPALIPVAPPIPAFSKWFSPPSLSDSHEITRLDIPYLTSAGSQDPLVQIEHTNRSTSTFEHLQIPWSYYLSFLDSPPSSSSHPSASTLYLAQSEPPSHLIPDIAPPSTELLSRLTKSSIWLGLTPTTTPLHRDPDSNLLYQLVGGKTVRLCEPGVGSEVLRKARYRAGVAQGSDRLRGEEMMRPGKGGERDELERAIWEDGWEETRELWEAEIGRGEALFIPKGWWHAVRGNSTREGGEPEVTASVNWWFR